MSVSEAASLTPPAVSPQFFLSEDDHVSRKGRDSPQSARKLDIVPHSAEGADNTDCSSSEWVPPSSSLSPASTASLFFFVLNFFPAPPWLVTAVQTVRCQVPGMKWACWARWDAPVGSSKSRISPVAMDDSPHPDPSPLWHFTLPFLSGSYLGRKKLFFPSESKEPFSV